MAAPPAPRLTPGQLAALLRAAEPAALLVPDRLLRRVIRYERLGGSHLRDVPHTQSYWVGRDALRGLDLYRDLPVPPGGELPETVLLLPESLADAPDPLRAGWRAL